MTGLFPYLRELLFGSARLEPSKCLVCSSVQRKECSAGLCWQHHYERCCIKNYWTGEIMYDCTYQGQEDRELTELRRMIQ